MQNLDVAEVLTHPVYGYKFARINHANPDCAHSSAWSHEDEQIVRDRWWHPKASEVVLDVGAAYGSYALAALSRGARVVAFSPADFDTRLLMTNLALNPSMAARCLVSRDGLHERDGWFDPDHSIFAVQPPPSDGGEHAASPWLRVRSLDSWMAERPGVERVDLVKIDVEGAELGVLRGAEATLRRFKPRLLIELHTFHVPTMAVDVWKFLSELGLGYQAQGPVQHCAVAHAFYEVA